MRRGVMPAAAATVFVMVVGALLTTPGSDGARAAEPDPRGRVVSSGEAGPASEDRALAYWTADRMRAARPMPAFETGKAPTTQPTMTPRAGRRPGEVKGLGPGSEDEVGFVAGGVGPAGYEYPFPYTRRALETQLYSVFPYRTVGKLFFNQNGFDYVCSAASVVSAPRQVVFTAGHCVNDAAGHWSTNLVFAPARRNGVNPYGLFPGRSLWSGAGWVLDGDSSWDVGAFNVGKNAAGQSLQTRVGALGFAWDQSRILHWDIFGYPAARPFSGETMQVCETSYAVDDYGLSDGPYTIGIGCDMTGGSSGGPWVLALRRGSYLNGVVSYGYSDQLEATYGPYFTTETNALRCVAATGNITVTTC